MVKYQETSREDYKEYSEIQNLEFLNNNYNLIEFEKVVIKVANNSAIQERKKSYLIQDWSNH